MQFREQNLIIEHKMHILNPLSYHTVLKLALTITLILFIILL